jgi:hypothetical protein
VQATLHSQGVIDLPSPYQYLLAVRGLVSIVNPPPGWTAHPSTPPIAHVRSLPLWTLSGNHQIGRVRTFSVAEEGLGLGGVLGAPVVRDLAVSENEPGVQVHLRGSTIGGAGRLELDHGMDLCLIRRE